MTFAHLIGKVGCCSIMKAPAVKPATRRQDTCVPGGREYITIQICRCSDHRIWQKD
jgi:hypothetical protein